ncbi:MAG: Arm DNA-binding domain-containing protein, partial [Woeseiaceae bacterium]
MAEGLTALFVKHVRRAGKYADGGSLYLQVRPSARKILRDDVTKSWLFRYSRFGKDTWLGLGPYPDVTLAEARNLASGERPALAYTDVGTFMQQLRRDSGVASWALECTLLT